MWIINEWHSWILGVFLLGALISMSQSLSISPWFFPVRPMTVRPLLLALLIASKMFFEFPDVLMAKRISPGLPRASTCLEKT